ncbi:Ca2+-binding EF-hand superfamily protein [Constrictibacter sp. MBR-5]|jgi:Ca2+-binding EF-hand superfamily protein|uniref:hypothetical protein n=1 Tax=Constrictibacter sp. MBR-5 TaxID=3156467 RepID=UPI00339586C8
MKRHLLTAATVAVATPLMLGATALTGTPAFAATGDSATKAPREKMGASMAAGGRDCALRFKNIDADGDGKVSDDEMKKLRTSLFDRLDTDKDGAITQQEYEACLNQDAAADAASKSAGKSADKSSGKPADTSSGKGGDEKAASAGERSRSDFKKSDFEKMDADGDGTVTRREYIEHARDNYQSLGGSVAAKEKVAGVKADAYAESRGPFAFSDRSADQDGNGIVSEGEAAFHAYRNFALLDSDGDQKLTGDEWRRGKPGTMAHRMFELMDLNDDGRITAEESAEIWTLTRNEADVQSGPVPVWVYQVYYVR